MSDGIETGIENNQWRGLTPDERVKAIIRQQREHEKGIVREYRFITQTAWRGSE